MGREIELREFSGSDCFASPRNRQVGELLAFVWFHARLWNANEAFSAIRVGCSCGVFCVCGDAKSCTLTEDGFCICAKPCKQVLVTNRINY